jgi:DNA-binding transcriptional MocR family regulator
MPTVAMRSAIRNLAKDDTAALAEYSNPHGQLALRRLLARQFANEGIEAGANQILLTSSGLAAGFTCGARCRAA